jgi:hypothetical protein
MTTLADEDIKTDELDLLALDRGYRYRIRSLTNALWVYTWEVFRPGRRGDSGPAFSLEEAVEKVKEAITHPRLVYCNHCGRNGTITRTVLTYEVWDEEQREWVDAEYRMCLSTLLEEGLRGSPRIE